MTHESDFEQAVRAWVAEGGQELPDSNLEAALREIDSTPQLRAGWLTRLLGMAGGQPPAMVVATVLAGAVLALALLPAGIGGLLRGSNPPLPTFAPGTTSGATATQSPVTTPTPAPTLPPMISGQVDARFGSVEIDATLRPEVSGSMEVDTGSQGHFRLRLRCVLLYEDGMVLIGGRVTGSTHPEVARASRAALAVLPGDEPRAVMWFEGRRTAPDCATFLDRAPDDFSDFLEPVDGTLRFGP